MPRVPTDDVIAERRVPLGDGVCRQDESQERFRRTLRSLLLNLHWNRETTIGREVVVSDADYEPIPPVPWALEKSCSPRAWCAGMRIALEGSHENSTGKGLSVTRGFLGEEKTLRLIGVTYRSSSKHEGIVLNLCPWCGRSIRFDNMGGQTWGVWRQPEHGSGNWVRIRFGSSEPWRGTEAEALKEAADWTNRDDPFRGTFTAKPF